MINVCVVVVVGGGYLSGEGKGGGSRNTDNKHFELKIEFLHYHCKLCSDEILITKHSEM